jgi:hypothetical protein
LEVMGKPAMVRLRLHDPSFTDELVSFLRRCQCQVRDLGRATVAVGVGHDVDTEAVVRRLTFGLCCRCGEEIEQALFRLGSPHCHDCREGSSLSRRADAEIRDEWTRMEVESYLRVWRALHPSAVVDLVA